MPLNLNFSFVFILYSPALHSHSSEAFAASKSDNIVQTSHPDETAAQKYSSIYCTYYARRNSDVNVNTLTRRDISCISKPNIWENCMPRLKQVSKKNASDNVKKYYNLLFGDRDPVAEPGTATGTPGNWWSVFALVPYIFDHATSHFGMFGMFASESVSKMDGAIRELAITRAGYTAASQFVYSQHCKAARRNGLSDEKIEAIPFWQVSDVFDAKEKAVLAWADALIYDKGRASDELFDALHSHLSDEDILELTYHVMGYNMHAVCCRALRLEFDDVPERIKEVPVPGEGEPADWAGSAWQDKD
jgi:alkylhydroperoxidase family enzyme